MIISTVNNFMSIEFRGAYIPVLGKYIFRGHLIFIICYKNENVISKTIKNIFENKVTKNKNKHVFLLLHLLSH